MKVRPLGWHHKKCRSNGGESTKENLSHVPVHLHQAWHNLFSNMTPQEIAKVINRDWLDPAFEFVVKRK